MESNYTIALNKGWDDLLMKDAKAVTEKVKVTYRNGQYIVPYFGENYIVDINERTITKQTDESVPSMDDRILILHYLSFFNNDNTIINAGKWVSLKEIPNGGALFYPAFHKTSILGLIDAFGSDPPQFLKCAKMLNGIGCAFGDAGAVFKIFPSISLCAAVWEGEDDIPPNATILYDPSIEYLLHIESVISLGMVLARKLIEAAAIL